MSYKFGMSFRWAESEVGEKTIDRDLDSREKHGTPWTLELLITPDVLISKVGNTVRILSRVSVSLKNP